MPKGFDLRMNLNMNCKLSPYISIDGIVIWKLIAVFIIKTQYTDSSIYPSFEKVSWVFDQVIIDPKTRTLYMFVFLIILTAKWLFISITQENRRISKSILMSKFHIIQCRQDSYWFKKNTEPKDNKPTTTECIKISLMFRPATFDARRLMSS